VGHGAVEEEAVKLVGGGICPKCGEPVRVIDSEVEDGRQVTEQQTKELQQAEQEDRLWCPCGGHLRYTVRKGVPADSKRSVGPK
jgi:transcription initiation factor IIE alpha subunit